MRARTELVSAVGRGVALLLDLRGLAAEVTEVVQLRATHVAAGHDLDLLDDRGVDREGALDADAEADLANGEGLADTVALAADGDALEDLDAGARALDDLDVDLQRVAGTEVRDVAAKGGCVDRVKSVHEVSLSRVATGQHGIVGTTGTAVWGGAGVERWCREPG